MLRVLKVTSSLDTTGETIEIFAINGDGTPYLLGSANGAGASVQVSVTCDFTVTPGTYKAQILTRRGNQNPKTIFPDDDDEDILIVVRPVEAFDYDD